MIPPIKRSGRPVHDENALPTSKQILYAAAKLFMEKGYETVSMNQVAEEANVTKATVYYYYPAKTDLFLASMVEVLSNVANRIQNLLDEPGSFQERLVRISTNYLRVPQVHMDDMLEHVRHHLSEDQLQQLVDSENAIYEGLQRGFEEAAGRGEIICEDPVLAAHIYVSMLRVGERQYSGDRKLFDSVEEAARSIVLFLWRGIHT